MSERDLRTSDIAKAVGCHPNTVRLYEVWGFLPPIPRSPSGYRRFTAAHLDQMRLAWTALKAPYPGGKRPALELVECAASGDLGGALEHAYSYLAQIQAERAHAETAAALLERWAQGTAIDATSRPLHIGETAELLGVTTDILRNWERNGLVQVPRDPRNGYRLYSAKEIGRLRVIRTLSRAGYGLAAILRMLIHLDQGGQDLRHALDTPSPDEDIHYATDRWLSTLTEQEQRALDVIAQLEAMIGKRQE